MKGKLLIVFYSKHGYVKRYVDILGNALGCDAVPADKLQSDMLGGYDKILYIGSIRGNEINGIKNFAPYLEAVYGKTIVCAVGMFPYKEGLPARIKDASISVAYEKFIPVFYAQGGFDVNELSRTDKLMISMRARQVKAMEAMSEEETFFLKATETPVDEVKKSNIQPLIDYLDGKTVDEKLYSPPEITDPEEEKKFFDELNNAAAAPEDKKRALKKKLKK